MRARQDLPDIARRLLQLQAGVISREQLLGTGVTLQVLKRFRKRGWRALLPGVYYAGSLEPTWEAKAWAGVLKGGPGAALGLHAAGYLHGFLKEKPSQFAVWLPFSTQRANSFPWTFRRSRALLLARGEPPRTSVERTVLDLCAAEPAQAVNHITAAVSGRFVSVASLRSELSGRDRIPARRALDSLLADVSTGVHSPLELLYARDVERAHGLPLGRRQSVSLRYRRDVHYDCGLVVELDGRVGHTGLGAFRDMNRDNDHLLLDQVTARYGWQQCSNEPCAVAEQVAALILHLGGMVDFRRCWRCRRLP